MALCARTGSAKVASHSAKCDARRAELETTIRSARAELDRLETERADAVTAYTMRRDSITSRLWAERPSFVDSLLADLDAEARTLRAECVSRLAQPDPAKNALLNYPRIVGRLVGAWPDGAEAIATVISNAAEVEARRRALFELGEFVKEATSKGIFSTEAELQKLVDVERAKLPRVPTRDELKARLRAA